jgi:hypothetical protein
LIAKSLIQIDTCMQFEQTKSNDKLDSYTLFNSLPIQAYKIVSNSNGIVSYQIEIDTVKQIIGNRLCCLINRKHDRIQTRSFSQTDITVLNINDHK